MTVFGFPTMHQDLPSTQRPIGSGVKKSVTPARVAIFCLIALSLSGCGAIQGASKAVSNQVGRDTFKPTKATVDDVSIHVYLDRSGSAEHLREATGKQVVNLLDLYPEAVKTTVHWYAQDVAKIQTTYASRVNIASAIKQFTDKPEGSPPRQKGTQLALAFQDLQMQCAREPMKRIVGIFVTDGGFEDEKNVLAREAERLRDIPNCSVLIFSGLDAKGTDKISLLDSVVRDRFGIMGADSVSNRYFDITLTGGEAMLAEAQEAIKQEIKFAKSNGKPSGSI